MAWMTGRGRITGILMAGALVLILIGIATGEPFDVMQKAVNICLECIGVG